MWGGGRGRRGEAGGMVQKTGVPIMIIRETFETKKWKERLQFCNLYPTCHDRCCCTMIYLQGSTCVSSHRKTLVQEVYIVKGLRIESKMYIMMDSG